MLDNAAGGRRLVGGMIDLSPFTFGIMRLDHAGSVSGAADLIRESIDLGVTTFHCSQEYGTWPLFVEAWNKVCPTASRDVQIIAKIGVPHFGETHFDPFAFRTKVDAYRKALDVEQVSIVQWLLRYDLQQEGERVAIFDRDTALIAETTQALRDAGVIGGLVSFPYTRAIAERALDTSWCDGLALYCNPLELEMVDLFDRASEREKSIIAVRPFAAGRLFDETTFDARAAVTFPLSHPAVVTVVASISTLARLSNAAEAAYAAPAKGWTANLRKARESVHV